MNQFSLGVSLLIYMLHLAESLDGIMEVSCDVTSNMCLYEHENNINWNTAYDKCLEMNSNLLTIPSNNVQTQANKFLNMLDLDTTTIWIAGKQSDNSTPIDLTGKPFLSNIFLSGDIQDDCVYVETNGELIWDNCDEINGNHQIICQYQGTCSGSDLAFGGNCYKFYMDATNGMKYSWFTARSICQESPGTDVIYTGLNNKTFLQNLSYYLDGNLPFWTGIYRRPWQWIEGSPKEAHTAHYFNFMSGQGGEAGHRCLQTKKLDGSYSWVWFTALCTEAQTRYYICLNETAAATAEATPVTSDITTLGDTQMSSDELADEETDTGFNPLYLIPVIVAVVAGVVVTVVMVLRNKIKQQPSVPVYENDESERTQEDPTSPPYQDIGEYLTTEQTNRVLNHTPQYQDIGEYLTTELTTRVLNYTPEQTNRVLYHTPEQTTRVLYHTPGQTTRALYQNVDNAVAEDSSNEVSASSQLDPAGGDYENIREDITPNPYSELDPNSLSNSLSTDHGPYTSLSPKVRD